MMASSSKHLIALFQGEARLGDVAHNLGRMKEQIRRASAAGAELIIFPELFLTGYQLGPQAMMGVAEERNGPSFQELAAAAREANIAVIYGYPEVDRSAGSEDLVYYNSAQLIDRDGKSLANYHKVHLWLDEDKCDTAFTPYDTGFIPGKEFAEVVECCGIKIGLLICYDIEFPEAARALALRGAQLIAVPTANRAISSIRIIPIRAMENRIHVAYVNHSGSNFVGMSNCCNQAGDYVILGGSDETLLLAPINLAGCPTLWSYLKDRRPEVYSK